MALKRGVTSSHRRANGSGSFRTMSDDPNPEQPRDPFAEAFKAANKPYEWPDPRPNEIFVSALWHEIKRRCALAWRWVTSIPQMVRRVRVIARVQMVAQEVSDADDLYSRIFPLPPKSPDHEAMRRAWVAITLQPNKSRSEVLQFADWLDGLEKDYGDDPLYALRHAKPAKILAAPAEASPQVQGFLGPVGAVAGGLAGKFWFYATCAVGAAAIVFALQNMALDAKLAAARAERDKANKGLEMAEDRNAGLAERAARAEAAVVASSEQIEDMSERFTAQQRRDAARNRASAERARKTQEAIDALRNGSSPGNGTLSDGLRDLGIDPNSRVPALPAEPASAAPAGLFSSLPGTVGPAPDQSADPGQPGSP